MDKLPIGYIKGKGNPLDKKVPRNKKYDYVKQTLNTGTTIRDIEVKVVKEIVIDFHSINYNNLTKSYLTNNYYII